MRTTDFHLEVSISPEHAGIQATVACPSAFENLCKAVLTMSPQAECPDTEMNTDGLDVAVSLFQSCRGLSCGLLFQNRDTLRRLQFVI